jgi:VWFA-related protein
MPHAVTTTLSRLGRIALPALAVALLTPAGGVAADLSGSFSERLDLVHVEVDLVVTDAKGRPVTDLERADVELYRDGARQEILTFGKPAPEIARPRQLIVYVDNLRIWPQRRDVMLRRMAGFVEERIARGDRISVVAFDGGVELLAVDSRDAGAVLASLEALESRPSAIVRTAAEARRLRQDLAQGVGVSALEPRIERYVRGLRADVARSLAGLAATIDAIARPSWSTSILYLSDGIPAWPGDEASGLGSGDVGSGIRVQVRTGMSDDPTTQGVPTPTVQYLVSYPRSPPVPRPPAGLEGTVDVLEPLIRLADGRGVSFYPIRPSSFLYPSIQPQDGAHGRADHITPLAWLAESTGGDLVAYPRFETALTRLSRCLDAAYTLGFQISAAAERSFHTLEIQLAGKGLKAHYRRAYVLDVHPADGPPIPDSLRVLHEPAIGWTRDEETELQEGQGRDPPHPRPEAL